MEPPTLTATTYPAILSPRPCRCGDGSCMMCDDNGMAHVQVRLTRPGHRLDGETGYVAEATDNAWGEVDVYFDCGDSDRVHWSRVEVVS